MSKIDKMNQIAQIDRTMGPSAWVNRLVYKTCSSSTSHSGHKLDIIKSGLQKYLRRRELDKMLWCLGEIYLFKIYEQSAAAGYESRAARGIITNVLNRFIVMLDEELLFMEWDKYLIVRNLIEKFEKSDRSDFISLVQICKILCSARLLRRNSDINGYFRYGSVRPPPLEERKKEELDVWNFRNFKAYFMLKNKKKARDCFYWMYKILAAKRERPTPYSIKRLRRRENIYMIWDFLMQQAFGNHLLTRCLEYRLKDFSNKSKSKSRGLFLTAAIDLCIEKDHIEWNPELLKQLPAADTSDMERIFKDRKRLIFDDYVIDMHCTLGRKLGKNAINFVESGAVVVNEDSEFLVEEWRNAYNTGKLESFAAKVASKERKAKKGGSAP